VGAVFAGFVIEVLQTRALGRSSNVLDALAGRSGFAAGWLLTAWARRRKPAATQYTNIFLYYNYTAHFWRNKAIRFKRMILKRLYVRPAWTEATAEPPAPPPGAAVRIMWEGDP
jgi:hypothetical protein